MEALQPKPGEEPRGRLHDSRAMQSDGEGVGTDVLRAERGGVLPGGHAQRKPRLGRISQAARL